MKPAINIPSHSKKVFQSNCIFASVLSASMDIVLPEQKALPSGELTGKIFSVGRLAGFFNRTVSDEQASLALEWLLQNALLICFRVFISSLKAMYLNTFPEVSDNHKSTKFEWLSNSLNLNEFY